MGIVSQSYMDFSNEVSVVSYNVANTAIGGVDVQSLLVATAALSIGTVKKVEQSTVVANAGVTPPTNPFAQREMKWLVKFVDDVTGFAVQVEIPCPDLTGNIVSASDLALVTSADWVAYIAAAEAVVKSNVGNAVSFVGASLVGRNI